MTLDDCALCDGAAMDDALMRTEVWSDDLWRLTSAKVTEVAGFSYLQPRHHIAEITELDGPEAESFGKAVAAASAAIKEATGAELVYVYIFGDNVPHLHVHLAPHRSVGSPLVTEMIKGARHRVLLPDGTEVWASDRYPLITQDITRAAIDGIRNRLNPDSDPEPEGP